MSHTYTQTHIYIHIHRGKVRLFSSFKLHIHGPVSLSHEEAASLCRPHYCALLRLSRAGVRNQRNSSFIQSNLSALNIQAARCISTPLSPSPLSPLMVTSPLLANLERRKSPLTSPSPLQECCRLQPDPLLRTLVPGVARALWSGGQVVWLQRDVEEEFHARRKFKMRSTASLLTSCLNILSTDT